MDRILITGVTGMVGSHLLDLLIDKTDAEIYCLIRWRSSLDNIQKHIDKINIKERIHLIYGDLRDSSSIDNLVKESKPNFVYHLGAQSYPKVSFSSPMETYDTNINGTERLLKSLKEHSKEAIIHICSSSEIFGRVTKDKLPINEECSFHPASPYAISKVGTDLIARHYAEAYGMNVQITRMFTHTGPRRGDVFAESTFAKQIAMIEKNMIDPVVKVGNLDSLRTWADVRDAVRAYHLLLITNPIPGAYYNIGGTYTCSIGDMLKKLISLSTNKNIDIEVDKERLRPIDADLQVPDTNKFHTHTGWKTQITFDNTMEDLLNYWRYKISTNEKFLTR